MLTSLETLNILKNKLSLADRECEEETSRRINDIRSNVRYEGGRLRVPNFQEAANTLVRVIYCKEKRFNAELSRVLGGSGISWESAEFKEAENLIAGYFKENQYLKSFDTFVQSIQRRASSYGVPFEPDAYRIDLVEAAYTAGVKNSTRRALESVRSELILCSHSKSLSADGTAITAREDIIELKPNFMGMGVNLRALFRRIWPWMRKIT